MSRSKTKRGRRSTAAARQRRAEGIPAWALLSAALSHDTRLQTWRPDVDAAVELAAEIALSKPLKFRYNRG